MHFLFNNSFRRLTLGLFIFSVYSSAALSNELIFAAEYSLHSKGLKVAKMERKHIVLPDGTHNFSSETKTVGLVGLFRNDHVLESTEWQNNASLIQPLKYQYQHTSKKKNRNVVITFDQSQQRIINSINEDKWTLPLTSNVYDKLLYQIMLMQDLASGTVPEKYDIADGGKIKAYRFSSLGKETIQTPLGEFEATKLSLHKDNKERTTILWCAEALNFLPVKVENTEKNGDKVTAIIETLNQ